MRVIYLSLFGLLVCSVPAQFSTRCASTLTTVLNGIEAKIVVNEIKLYLFHLMTSSLMRKIKFIISVSLIFFCSQTVLFAQSGEGSLSGQVQDSLGGIIVGAAVSIIDSAAKEKKVVTNKQGEFSVSGLSPGKYTVRASAPKFSLYENTEIEITAGRRKELTITLSIAAIETDIEVGDGGEINTDPANNASQTVLKGKDIDDLPDDPNELEAYLRALAGAAAGPDGAQITIDGFSGGRMPPKEAIREIRINQNPFSAEYDRIGFSRVEILTKPGFDKFHGGVNFNFNDEILNARNPFATNRAPSQTRAFGGNLSGPFKAKRSSFFLDFSYQQNDNNNIITATILDASNNIVGFSRDFTIPSRRVSFSPRIDYAIDESNILQARYSFSRNTSENQGIGGFSLPSQSYRSTSDSHIIQLSESMIINHKTVNETRFQYQFDRRVQNDDNSIPTIIVSGAFTGGGPQTGNGYNRSSRWELQNYTTSGLGKALQHALKFGLRIRAVTINDQSATGYGGTFTFTGIPGLFSSIEQYRQKVLGNPDPIFNPAQFSLTTGNPLAVVSQIDYGLFITDDWKARQDLTLSFGLRYENQTNFGDNLNFAPRVGFAWQPGAGGATPSKTVFRGGFGIFYDRFSEGHTLTAKRRDGVSQISYVVTNNPAILSQAVFTNTVVTNVPSAAQLASVASLTGIPYRVDAGLQAPYSIQSVISVERPLPGKSTISATFIAAKSLHTLRMRNINAPVCPPAVTCPDSSAGIQLLRPYPAQGNIFQFESSGYSSTKQLAINFSTRFTNKINLFGNYTLSDSKGDSDGLRGGAAAGFPAYSYDLSQEFAETSFNARHNIFIGGSATLPWGVRLSPMITGNSSRKFNLTTGVDSNRDSIFAERPAYFAVGARCQELALTNSFCNFSRLVDSNSIIPRNYGVAPGSFQVNLSLVKAFGFGGQKKPAGQSKPADQGSIGGDGQQMIRNAKIGMIASGDANKPYNLSVGINVRNLFNNVNLNPPQGSLTSPFFGRSISTGGARRIDLSLRFNW